jgi:hypothetical protein
MIKRGIRLIKETIGHGPVAEKGDHLIYNLRVYLNRGEEVPINDLNENAGENLKKCDDTNLTIEDGYKFINFNTRLGQHGATEGVEYSLYGMREGGYRKVKVSPNLAYRMKEISGRVPPNAAIIFEIWLRKIIKKTENESLEKGEILAFP